MAFDLPYDNELGPYFCISFEKILKYFMLDLAKQACLVLMIEMKIA